MGQSASVVPAGTPYVEARWKSSSQKRGVLASQCMVPPPTPVGRWFTNPVKVRSPSDDLDRKVRGSAKESASEKWRSDSFTSSLPKWGGPIGSAARSPFSRTTTSQPAWARV